MQRNLKTVPVILPPVDELERSSGEPLTAFLQRIARLHRIRAYLLKRFRRTTGYTGLFYNGANKALAYDANHASVMDRCHGP